MIKKIFFNCTIIYFIFPSVIAAHPGNTDSSGGHTCRTNCDDWGLNYGEYHYHDNEGDTYDYYELVDDYDEGYDEGYDLAYSYTSECEKEYDREWKGTQDYGDGFENGIEDGYWDGLQVCYEDSYAAGMEVGKDESYEGIEYNEDREIEDWYDADSYLKGYVAGYDEDAYADARVDNKDYIIEETQINQKEPSEEEEAALPFIAGIIGVVGIIAISVIHDHFRVRKGKKKQG